MYKSARAGVGAILLFLVPLNYAQTPPSSSGTGTLQPSDPQAVKVVEKAIRAMGGREAWREAGGATAQSVITSPGLPPRTVNWSDDWSKGRVRFRRDSAASEAKKTSLIGSDASQVHKASNGKSMPLPHDNGIVVLVPGYPAAALIHSQAKYTCTFQLGKTAYPQALVEAEDPDAVTVTERCPAPFYPQGAAILVWTFSKSSGLPKMVEVPVWGLTHQIIRHQTVSYVAFQNVNGLLVPSRLHIRRISGMVDELAISNTIFAESIADEKFKPEN